VVNKAKYYVVIDNVETLFNVETMFDAVQKDTHIVKFSIYKRYKRGDIQIFSGVYEFDYEDESTKEYVRDIARLFREIGAFI
jgi:hypothetical protein